MFTDKEIEHCKLMGLTGIFIQSIIGALSVLSLFIKRTYEVPRRRTKVFLLDMFKQCCQIFTVHTFNIIVSLTYTGNDDHTIDECTSYLASFLLDVSLGILFTYLLLKYLELYFTKKKYYVCKQGNFIKKSGAISKRAYFVQTLIWIAIALVVKILLFLIFLLIPQVFLVVAELILYPISFSSTLRLLTVILIIPLICNILTFFVFDQWIKKKYTKKQSDESDYLSRDNSEIQSDQSLL